MSLPVAPERTASDKPPGVAWFLHVPRQVFLHLLFFALPGGLAVVVVAGTEAWIRLSLWWGLGGTYGAADGMTPHEMGNVWWIGLGAAHAVVWLALYDRLYLRTPAEYIRSQWQERSPGPFVALSTFGGLFLATGFVVTLPAAATLGALHGLGVAAWWGRFPAAAVFLFGLPGLVAGITMLRRSVWLWRIKGQLEHLPTSTVRGAALGLVELKGVASAEADGVGTGAPLITRKHGSYHTVPFFLEDDSGRVRVIPPEGHSRGEDERITLTRRAVAQGAMVEATLLTGDPVYVLGNLEPAAGGPEAGGRVVRPMKTPYARLLDTRVMGALPVASFLSSFLGLGFVQHADFFLLTDASEADAKSRFCRQWRRTLAWGLVWFAVSLPLASWGLRGIVEPGSAGLLRAVEGR